MGFVDFIRDMRVRIAALIFSSFLLCSTGWLSWLSSVIQHANPEHVDLLTMVIGYLAQALGLTIFIVVAAALEKRSRKNMLPWLVITALVVFAVLLDPATTADSLEAVLGFGWIMNIVCGFAQGYYLYCLAAFVGANKRGTVLGCGYAASTLVSWLISSIGGGFLASGPACLVLCSALAIISAALVFATREKLTPSDEQPTSQSNGIASTQKKPAAVANHSKDTLTGRKLILFACATVVMVSLVKNAGFSFPSEDLSDVVNLELSRLFYGIGLVVAGIMADRERSYVLGLCALSLVSPFIMLALGNAGASGVIMWAIGYLLFGFFTVFRIVLLADIAANDGRFWIAPAGLLFGRLGDVLGTAICLALGSKPLMLILITSILFAFAAWMLFMLYHKFFLPNRHVAVQVDPLNEFCTDYALSARERQIIPLLVEGKTYAEIAADLYVTESTVKFHTRNIREKTGYATRMEVVDLYTQYVRNAAQNNE